MDERTSKRQCVADEPQEAKTGVAGGQFAKYYMLHYSKNRTRVTKCDSGEGVKVEICEPTIKKVIVSLNDTDAAVLSCNVGKNVRMFSDVWERLCKQQTLTQWIETKETYGHYVCTKPILTLLSFSAL